MNDVKNLSQLKRAIESKRKFKIIQHYKHDMFVGQVRIPNVIQTNGFYSVVDGEPDNIVSTANGGKGFWCGYGKAKDYEFGAESIVIRNPNGSLCMEIAFI